MAMRLAAARGVAVAAVLMTEVRAAVQADADAGWELLATSMGDEVERTCFKAPELSADIDGDFYISGPARFEKGGYRFRSIFDGYGRTNRFEVRKGEVCFTSKWMNTQYFRTAEMLGRISNGLTFYGVEPPLPPCPLRHPLCAITGAQMDNNWVWMIPVAGKGLMTTDSPFFVDMDLESLNCTGRHNWPMMPDWIKPLYAPAGGSAHPVLRPKTESTWVEVLMEVPMNPLGTPLVGIYTFDGKDGAAKRTQVAQVPVKHSHYFHSFGVTENYVVLPCNLGMGVPTSGHLLDAFKGVWDGIRVVDFQGNVQVFETDPFFHVHIANSFENATGIVMDVGTYQEVPFRPSPQLVVAQFLNKTLRDAQSNLAQFSRLHLHLAGPLKGQVTKEIFALPKRTVDFFSVNPSVRGLPYCIHYAVEWYHDEKSYASMAVQKHNLCDGTRTYWSKPNSYPGEPFFVAPEGEDAASAAEDDGFVVFITLNGQRRATDFVVLDAKNLEEIAVVELPVHIPFTAHGQFIPRAMQEVRAGGSTEDIAKLAATLVV